MQKHILAVALAIAVAFAGCIEMDGLFPHEAMDSAASDAPQETEEPQEQEPQDENETTPPPTTPPTTPPPEPENRAPAAQLALAQASGPAPFNVTITLDGSDPDGDALTWSLDLGDGSDAVTGEELPTTLSHNFTQAGNFTLTLSVMDGELTGTATANVTVQGATSGDVPDPITLTGSLLVPSPQAETYCVSGGALNARVHIIPDEAQNAGWVYQMEADEENYHLRWFNGAPGTVPWFLPEAGNPPVRSDATAAPGMVPDGATTVEVCLNADLPESQVTYTFRLYHPDHPDAPAL